MSEPAGRRPGRRWWPVRRSAGEASVRLVLESVRRFHESDQQLRQRVIEQMSMNDTDLRALRHLVESQRSGVDVSPGALSEHLGISTASTTKLIRRLSAAGHLVTVPHPHDRRSMLLQVTSSAELRMMSLVAAMSEPLSRAVATFSPAERAVIVAFLDAMNEAVDRSAPG